MKEIKSDQIEVIDFYELNESNGFLSLLSKDESFEMDLNGKECNIYIHSDGNLESINISFPFNVVEKLIKKVKLYESGLISYPIKKNSPS